MSATTSARRRPRRRATIRTKGVVTLPQDVRDELDLHEGDEVIITIKDGAVVLIPASVVPRDQEWFWTPEWQAGEREIDEAIARGEHGHVFMDGDEFIAALEAIDRDATGT